MAPSPNIKVIFFCGFHRLFITVLNQLHKIDILVSYFFNINFSITK